MLDELKNIFPENSLQAVTELLKASQQIAKFIEDQFKDNDKEKINCVIDHFKTLMDFHKK